MSNIELKRMQPGDWAEVADLIYVSTNYWYEAHGHNAIFTGGPEATRLFCKVYEDLDPGHCVIARNPETGRIMGSCFMHPRETHVSLGIMNVHPVYFGRGIARKLLNYIIEFAEQEKKPVRLVSSAMNLDSFSLYTRAGFVPRATYQDLLVPVPKDGLPAFAGGGKVRAAKPEDVDAIAAVELAVSGISRKKDYRYFIENRDGHWSGSVLEGAGGALDGFLFSLGHKLINMVGPGVAKTEAGAAALLHAQLNQHKGRTPLVLAPVECGELVQTLYGWGAKNCETHLAQVRGACAGFKGVTMPCFLPETA